MSQATYENAREQCRIHAQRLHWAMTTLKALRPLTPEKLAALSAVDLAVFDQFVVRFGKLQDTIGNNTTPHPGRKRLAP